LVFCMRNLCSIIEMMNITNFRSTPTILVSLHLDILAVSLSGRNKLHGTECSGF